MPSPKLIQILRSKTDLSDEEIIPLTDNEAWSKIYAVDAEKRKNRPPKRPEVCFTGFSKKDKEYLEALAFEKGFDSKGSVTKSLKYLVIGETPGESKVIKAKSQEILILQKNEFELLDSQ